MEHRLPHSVVVSYISQTLGMESGNGFRSFHPLFLVRKERARKKVLLAGRSPRLRSVSRGMSSMAGKPTQWTCGSERLFDREGRVGIRRTYDALSCLGCQNGG